METTDYLIIGGGIVGITIAYHLARRNEGKVVLCERRALASGTTAFSGAMCGQQAAESDTISKLAVRALHAYENFEEEVGGSCGFFNHGLLVARSDLATTERYAAAARRNGSTVQVLKPDEIHGVYPEFNLEGVEAAAFFPRTGCVDAFQTVHSYAQAARDLGADLREFCPVTRFNKENGRITSVDTEEGSISAGKVVLACGPWSLKLASAMGVHLPIENVRVGVSFYRRPPGFFTRPPVVWVDGIGGFVPWHAENIRVLCDDRKPRIPVEPDPTESTCPNWMVDRCSESIRHHLPAMRRGMFQGGYATCYDETPDRRPLLGFVDGLENLFIDCGWSGKGFKYSVALGSYLADWIHTGNCPLDLAPWLASRFQVTA